MNADYLKTDDTGWQPASPSVPRWQMALYLTPFVLLVVIVPLVSTLTFYVGDVLNTEGGWVIEVWAATFLAWFFLTPLTLFYGIISSLGFLYLPGIAMFFAPWLFSIIFL